MRSRHSFLKETLRKVPHFAIPQDERLMKSPHSILKLKFLDPSCSTIESLSIPATLVIILTEARRPRGEHFIDLGK